MDGVTPKPHDIIEIIESHYVPTLKIGNRYVVMDSFDGYDVWVIDERGKYTGVCGEDFKIVGSVDKVREAHFNALKERDEKLEEVHNRKDNEKEPS